MKIKFWGVRGSHTVSGIDFLKYGGNTTCLSVEVEDKIFLIDAGSGIPHATVMAYIRKKYTNA
jgi:phosphoribosyl 1,2-cyclic phosphodiesterase